jgi:hypothetical protein
MKTGPELVVIFLLGHCTYDPPLKGKELWIHNQTDKAFLVLDSLDGNSFKLYDTSKVNDRVYITRQPNFVTEFTSFTRFYSNKKMNVIRLIHKNWTTLYFIDEANIYQSPQTVLASHTYRSFRINIDTLAKYELNHLFITRDTILFEHDYAYSKQQVLWKH